MKYTMTLEFAVTAIVVFVLTVLAERLLIPILRSHKAGQRILEIGPRWHKSKEGTPIMGGIGFILATLLVATAFFVVRAVRGTSAQYIPLALTLAFAVGNGAIGFVDDYCKLIKKQNEGLKWYQKLILQFTIAIAYVAVMSYMKYMDTDVALPFTSHVWHLGWGYYPLAVIALVAVTDQQRALTHGEKPVCRAPFPVSSAAKADELGRNVRKQTIERFPIVRDEHGPITFGT